MRGTDDTGGTAAVTPPHFSLNKENLCKIMRRKCSVFASLMFNFCDTRCPTRPPYAIANATQKSKHLFTIWFSLFYLILHA